MGLLMTNYRKWALALIGALALFTVSNYIIWKCFTEDILASTKYYNGGLDRMGYIVGSKHYRNHESTLPKKHIENKDYRGQHIDVITIGDSFSNVLKNGKDPMYQDWIASLHGLDVLNIQPFKDMDELQSIVILLNSGYLDVVKPRAIILESVERYCIMKYRKPPDFSLTKSLAEVEEYFRTAEFKVNPPPLSFINTGNLKFIEYTLLYQFSDNAFFSKVYMRDLDTPFFSVKKSKRLLFYHEDIEFNRLANEDSVGSFNRNLNELALQLKKKGITLYFLPAPDKYNMYSDYIVDNPYPKSVFFELLRTQPKEYVFVDTKAILSELIRKEEKDVYYADDTHWSWKAARKIAESMEF